ncbi:MAG: hypothetical protein FWC50_14385 [Planctomycetaceae bacterium]|nr:hypothetical protein [Planctomycetaceae bacterium]
MTNFHKDSLRSENAKNTGQVPSYQIILRKITKHKKSGASKEPHFYLIDKNKTTSVAITPPKLKLWFPNGSRERNEVKRPDHPAFDPVTALRFVPGCH